jgi:CDP-2,3-bis-(O-geranylgeranyl)-sn-glycerol synthase
MKRADMPHVQPLVVVQLMVLLGLANGTPVIAKKVLGTILARPLDGGMNLADGQPLFGDSKTIRGIVLSIVVTTLGAPLIGVDWTIGVAIAATAMIGDLFSSFTKRRMALVPGSMALGLDQIPESLLPAITCRWMLPVTALDIVLVAALFFVGELVVSRALYTFKIRDRPY